MKSYEDIKKEVKDLLRQMDSMFVAAFLWIECYDDAVPVIIGIIFDILPVEGSPNFPNLTINGPAPQRDPSVIRIRVNAYMDTVDATESRAGGFAIRVDR